MIDIENDNSALVLVDAVAHPVLASTGSPQPLERFPQRCSDDARTLVERPGDELPGGERRHWR